MKASARKNYQISDFKIIFRPLSATFHKQNHRKLKLYLQKSVQVIGEIKDIIPPLPPKELVFSFPYNTETIMFRALAEKGSYYQISLYEMSKEGTESFVESSEFKLTHFLEEYMKDFKNLQEQLYIELKGKDSKLPDIWRVLSNNFSKKFFQSAVKFTKNDIVVQFTCTPEGDYDEMIKTADIAADNKRNKQKKHGQYARSRTVPELLKHEQKIVTAKKYHESQNEQTLAQKGKHRLRQDYLCTKEELKSVKLSIPYRLLENNNFNSIPEADLEDGASTIKIATNGVDNDNFHYHVHSSNDNNTLPIDDVKHETRSIDESVHSRKSSLPEQIQKFYDIRNEDGYIPKIHVNHFHELIMPQNQNYSKIGNLNVQSSVEMENKPSQIQTMKWRQMAIGTGVLVLYSVMILFLMHPIAKVG